MASSLCHAGTSVAFRVRQVFRRQEHTWLYFVPPRVNMHPRCAGHATRLTISVLASPPEGVEAVDVSGTYASGTHPRRVDASPVLWTRDAAVRWRDEKQGCGGGAKG